MKNLKDFKQIIENDEKFQNEIDILGKEVIEFSVGFVLPGGDDI